MGKKPVTGRSQVPMSLPPADIEYLEHQRICHGIPKRRAALGDFVIWSLKELERLRELERSRLLLDAFLEGLELMNPELLKKYLERSEDRLMVRIQELIRQEFEPPADADETKDVVDDEIPA